MTVIGEKCLICHRATHTSHCEICDPVLPRAKQVHTNAKLDELERRIARMEQVVEALTSVSNIRTETEE